MYFPILPDSSHRVAICLELRSTMCDNFTSLLLLARATPGCQERPPTLITFPTLVLSQDAPPSTVHVVACKNLQTMDARGLLIDKSLWGTVSPSALGSVFVVPGETTKTGGPGPIVVAQTQSADPERAHQTLREAARLVLAQLKHSGFSNVALTVSEDLPPAAVATSILGLLAGMYEPLQARENRPATLVPCSGDVSRMTIRSLNMPLSLKQIQAVEWGRRLARDLAGSDPERMTPALFAEYVRDYFRCVPHVRVDIEEDMAAYPCIAAVARASMAVERHRPRVLRIVVSPPAHEGGAGRNTERKMYLVGKGVVYDTGGADVKVGGRMYGMSRDKAGAAAVAGLMLTAALLRPAHVQLVGLIGLVRNSVGADAYVADEILRGRSGRRILVRNTDAEGRMVMADLLSVAREEVEAGEHGPARIVSVATLTGHAASCAGGYTVAIDNEAARELAVAEGIKRAGDALADGVEVSTLRDVDVKRVLPPADQGDYDVLQHRQDTDRGHQMAFAFLVRASGLDGAPHIPYTHLDIAGSAAHGTPDDGYTTGSPIVALTFGLNLA
jgi:leucyl aminopeptidase